MFSPSYQQLLRVQSCRDLCGRWKRSMGDFDVRRGYDLNSFGYVNLQLFIKQIMTQNKKHHFIFLLEIQTMMIVNCLSLFTESLLVLNKCRSLLAVVNSRGSRTLSCVAIREHSAQFRDGRMSSVSCPRYTNLYTV